MPQDSTELKQAMFQVTDGVLGAAVLVGLGVFGGNWLDDKLHTAPWLVVTLSVVGGGLGLVRLVKKAMTIGDSSSARGSSRVAKKTDASADENDAGHDSGTF